MLRCEYNKRRGQDIRTAHIASSKNKQAWALLFSRQCDKSQNNIMNQGEQKKEAEAPLN